jgi:hypothetical protein
MKKNEIYDIVTKEVNPLIEKLKNTFDGSYPTEEYSIAYWTRENLRELCDRVFEQTHKHTINATTNVKKRK